jgi:coenzyme F420-reducing hydrogenase delta subunit/ferredoxin
MSPTTIAAAPAPWRPAPPVALLDCIERLFDRIFGQAGNPWRHLGGLAFLLFWIVAATGIYLYIGFDARGALAYASVERLSADAFPLSALARSLHRYASDAFVLVIVLHVAREWVLGRYAHFRRFSWLTGVAALWLAFASGIGGFWLVWDRLAQYSLIATTEWLDVLPVFGGTLTRNFIAAAAVSDRLFSLLMFLHIGLPLALLAGMWVHLQRLSRPASHPPRALALGTVSALTLIGLALPVASDAPAALDSSPGRLGLDWFYLGIHAFADAFSPLALWLALGGITLLLLALPYLSHRARSAGPRAALVDAANCNGCARCFADCPYAAVTMVARTDGKALPRQALVDPDLCAGCGICAGACPSSTPFRSLADLVTGIDVPDLPMRALRANFESALRRIADAAKRDDAGPGIVVFGCVGENGGADMSELDDARTAMVTLVCAAQLPPSFIEYALRAGADGVLVTGCRDNDCAFRLGNRWVEERLDGKREPHLRPVVRRERVRVAWTGGDGHALRATLRSLRADLSAARSSHPSAALPPKRAERTRCGSARP